MGFVSTLQFREVLIKTGNMQLQKCQIANNWILLYSAGSLLFFSLFGCMLQEYCPNRRRMKRSVATTISQVYGELYDHLIDRHEMEHFLRFDLNRDGLVSFEEANNSINATIEEFAEIDTNKDGFVHPAEFDESLI